MRPNSNYKQARLLASCICFSLVICGCASWGDVSETYQIDQGTEPEYQDKMVRFRTTYYFRVVDSCHVNDGIKENSYSKVFGVLRVRKEGKLKIVNDSLYRFRMTGKGNALFSTVHFESGVLREEQIDPFGSSLKYNREEGVYRVDSSSRVRERARRDTILEEIKKLQELEIQLGDKHSDSIKPLIETQLKLLAIENNSGMSGDKSPADGGNVNNILCPNGHPITQSYFLYGPEGVRKLDPDERLIMAMTVDSKPLISMLQQISGKQTQSQQSSPDSFKVIVEEQEKIYNSFKTIDSVEDKLKTEGKLTNEDLSTLLDTLKAQLKE